MGSGSVPAAPEHRRLVLLRHAKSSWEDDLPDAERPLSPRGRRDAAAVGHWLAAQVGRPDLVLCSPALRTRQTWTRVCEAGPDVLGTAPVRLEPAIYQASTTTLLALVRELAEDLATVLLVGHAPGLPDLAHRLAATGGGEPLGDFPTSAVAVLRVGRWAELGVGTAALDAYAVPRG